MNQITRPIEPIALEPIPSRKNKTAEYYLALPYPTEVMPIPEELGGGFNACIPLLGRYSAVGDGETAEEAYADLRAVLPSLLEEWIREGVDIPEPEPAADESRYSGRMMLRVPKTLHARVARRAQAEGVSINQFIAVTLAQEVGSGR